MSNIMVVQVYNPEKYKPFGQTYGLLIQSMDETAVINWNSNMGGICTNVSHGDYGIVSPDRWDIYNNEVVIICCGGYIRTGLKVWG